MTTWAYGYDLSGRLTNAIEQGLSSQIYVYAYAGAGNRICGQIDGVASTESANSVNQITNQSGSGTVFTHGLACNLTTKSGSGGT